MQITTQFLKSYVIWNVPLFKSITSIKMKINSKIVLDSKPWITFEIGKEPYLI